MFERGNNTTYCDGCCNAVRIGNEQLLPYTEIIRKQFPVTAHYCNTTDRCIDKCIWDLQHGYEIVHVFLNEEENKA